MNASSPPLHRSRAVAAAIALACVLVPGASQAFPYTAKRGDTLAGLAERFYGKVEMEKVLVAANGFDDQVPLIAGMRIEVPAVSFHRIAAGESWASLAEAQLGDARRAEALALSNETMPWIPPSKGREIVVPYPLRYEVKRGDSTPSIAYRFLGRRDDALVVDRFNNLRGEPVEPGDVVLVPVVDLVLTDEGKEAAKDSLALIGGEGAGDDHDAQERVERELPALEEEVRKGRYLEAIVHGNQLLGAGTPTDPQLAAIERQLVEAYVALDELELARGACADWRRANPELVLDPIRLSPKILRACTGVAASTAWGAMGADDPAPSASASAVPPVWGPKPPRILPTSDGPTP